MTKVNSKITDLLTKIYLKCKKLKKVELGITYQHLELLYVDDAI